MSYCRAVTVSYTHLDVYKRQEVTFVDSTGIGFVLARYKQLQKLHAQLILCNLSRVNQTLFKMSGIFQIMKHERNEVKL